MLVEPLLKCYQDRPQNSPVNTTPGRKIHFHGGLGLVHHESDVVHLLRQPGLTIYVQERVVGSIDKWLESCGEFKPAQAKIVLGDGVIHHPPYATLHKKPKQSRAQKPQEEAPRWVNPNESNSASVDPDSLAADGGLHPINTDGAGDDDDAVRRLVASISPDPDAG